MTVVTQRYARRGIVISAFFSRLTAENRVGRRKSNRLSVIDYTLRSNIFLY